MCDLKFVIVESVGKCSILIFCDLGNITIRDLHFQDKAILVDISETFLKYQSSAVILDYSEVDYFQKLNKS
jgi:hypothetical protein